VSLFDLKSDPSEKTNLAESKPELVQEMENLLLQVRKNSIKQEMAEMDDAETKKIQEELKKLGYL
jgi:HPt (histidine-containing phosphotransfer) domain-containing protein